MASLALGILGMLIWCLPMFGLPVNLLGLVLGGKAVNSPSRSLAISAIVLNSIGLILNVLGFTLMLAARSSLR